MNFSRPLNHILNHSEARHSLLLKPLAAKPILSWACKECPGLLNVVDGFIHLSTPSPICLRSFGYLYLVWQLSLTGNNPLLGILFCFIMDFKLEACQGGCWQNYPHLVLSVFIPFWYFPNLLMPTKNLQPWKFMFPKLVQHLLSHFCIEL